MLLNVYYALYSYIWVVMVFILFLLFINNNLNVLINTNFKLYTTSFKKFNFFFFLLSLAGVPPLLGFFNKIFLITVLINTYSHAFIIFFIIINTFLLIFYIQQVKFLQNSKKKFIFFKKSYVTNNSQISFFIWLQTLNQFAIFILPNFISLSSFYVLCAIK